MPSPAKAGRFDIADIVRAHRAQLEASQGLSTAVQRVLTGIASCRTAALGGHVDRCRRCDYERPSYNSCRNRHCPKCQALTQEEWIEEQQSRMLDVKHFHVVFTLPSELRPLAAFAPRILFDALLRLAGRVLLEFGETHLQATIGATLVLHTWTRELHFHPHAHAIVTAGGLSHDETRWAHCRHVKFLFPVYAMGIVLRGKMIDELKEAYRQGAFEGFDDFRDPDGFARLIRKIAKIKWNVYAKPSFAKGALVLQYLGRYTHRVGISNSRLLDVTDEVVTFRTKGEGTATVTPVEFLRRFVQHVLPGGFHKIRHVGLNASPPKRALARCKLELATPTLPLPKKTWAERLEALTGRDVSCCPQCGGTLAFLSALARAPPSDWP